MTRSDKTTKELPLKAEGTNSPGEVLNTRESGKARGKNESFKSKEYSKKKRDALEGKDNKPAKSSQSDPSKGKRQDGYGKKNSADKSAKAAGSGSRNQSSLQSAQTTVQFSSGGGGSFGSLLALFASSSSLVRAESGSISTLYNQTTNLNLQNISRLINNQSGSLLGDEGKNIRYVGKVTEQTIESGGKQFNIEAGGALSSNSSSALQDAFSAVLRSISANAAEGNTGLSDLSKTPIISIEFNITIYEGFNVSNFFFPEITPFAFSNSTKTTIPILGEANTPIPGTDGSPAVALQPAYPGIIDTYFSEAGFGKPGVYTYEVISPAPLTTDGISQTHGLTIAKNDDLSVKLTSAPEVVGTQINGLTLSEIGDLYSNVSQPLSVLVKINGGGNELIVRINVGPGEILDHPNDLGVFGGSVLTGLHVEGSDAFASTVFRDYGPYKVVGNAQAIVLNSPDSIIGDPLDSINGNLAYIEGVGGPLKSVIVGSFNIEDTYIFPSNTIFRHVGTSNETAPTQAAYGNFSNFVHPDFVNSGLPATTFSTFNFLDGHSYNLSLGKNVLDVFGTKYGEGDRLDLNLAMNPSGANTITMGGNTLAGFGLAVGDIGTLNISSLNETHSSVQTTTLTFNGNILWVDKNVDSILYPHLQDLQISNNITKDSNLQIVFKDSILHGNLGADTFYGDVDTLGDLNNASRNNDFITGVNVGVTPDGHVVTTALHQVLIAATATRPAYYEYIPTNNSITWGNNIYHGGADPGFPSVKDINTYNFTLLGTVPATPESMPQTVMLGNHTITNFKATVDTLDFQLTSALFRALDINHDKIISAQDLNSGVTFDATRTFVDPFTFNTVNGTYITFTGGGSLVLQGLGITSFEGITNIKTNVNITYAPVANLPSDQITSITSIAGAPYIYGKGPNGLIHSYFNELDNYFANSLLAHYTVSGLTDPFTGFAIEGVTIDRYGTITVDTEIPYIIPITITATTINPDTQQVDTVTTNPMLFGFLNAPIKIQPDGISSNAPVGINSNILIGGLDSKIVGGPIDNFNFTATGMTLENFNDDPGGPGEEDSITRGSNLIVNTTNSTTAEAYGNYKIITLGAQGTGNDKGLNANNDFNFKANAFYVNGKVFGVAEVLNIQAAGSTNSVINFVRGNSDPVNVNATGIFENNEINIGSQLIYGNGAGTLTGIFKDININVIPRAPGAPETPGGPPLPPSPSVFNVPEGSKAEEFNGTIDTSSSVQNNTFNFGETKITIIGDTAGQTSTIYGNVENLTIIAKNVYFKIISPTLVDIAKATFTGNKFVFSDADLTSGIGNTDFFGHLAKFGDAYNHNFYNGFVKGASVTYTADNSHLIINDSKGNSITWGNNIYTGGVGEDKYNYTIVGDTQNKPIMQGLDTIYNFDLSNDKIVFNITRLLFDKLGMNETDSIETLLTKLDNNGVDASGTNIITISFTGPAGSLYSYGHIILNTTGNIPITNLVGLKNNIIITSVGDVYKPPELNALAAGTFDPVFVKIDQPFAFADFLTNADLDSFTWGATIISDSPSAFNLTQDGTLQVLKNTTNTAPVDAFITATVHDDISPSTIITLPTIHVFGLNTTSKFIFYNSTIQGSRDTEAYETKEAGNTIIGGGADIIYKAGDILEGSITYGSKLIYDVSEGGHTAIGDVRNIQFINTASANILPPVGPSTHAVSSLNGEKITFSDNMFNINSDGSGTIYGNAETLEMIANASNDGALLVDATINSNIFKFGNNTIYTVGSITAPVSGDSFTVYGNLKTLNLSIINGSSVGTVGDAHITGNEFRFGNNKLVGSSDNVTLNPGIGTLSIINKDTSAHDPLTGNPTPISGNKFIFSDSKLIGGMGHTYFNADIADLSNTAFVLGTVTSVVNGSQHIEVKDSQNNVITWGNNSYQIQNGSLSNTLTFTLLSMGGSNAAMQGKATVEGFRVGTDTLDLKLAPTLFKGINTNFDRTISVQELNASGVAHFDPTAVAGQTTLSFASGSIVFKGNPIADFSGFSSLNTQLAYTPAPITVKNPTFSFAPLVLLTNGENGNILDKYFSNVDIGNEGSTYVITESAAYAQLIDSEVLYNPAGTGEDSLFDKYGTARPENISSNGPTLAIINVELNDAHDLNHKENTDIIVASFDGAKTLDTGIPAGGTFIGSMAQSSYLQGSVANETIIGNADQLVINVISNTQTYTGTTYGTDKFGGNLIINTNANNQAYGDFRNIKFSVDNTSLADSAQLISSNFIFNPNALYVNGKASGVADKLSIDVHNSVSGSVGFIFGNQSSSNFGSAVDISQYTFGSQTVFGQGTLIGDLNTFHINVFGNTTATLLSFPFDSTSDVTSNVINNNFTFAPTEIVSLGSDHSTIFQHINSLSLFTQQGASASHTSITDGITYTQVLDASANIKDNKFIFQNSVAVGGAGGVDYYSDVNDLSGTSLWTSNSVYFDTTGTNISTTDAFNNIFTWGNNELHLSPEANSPDVIHLNLLQNQNQGTGLLGNLDVYNFKSAVDSLQFNLSSALYKTLNGGSNTLNGSLTAASLDGFNPGLGSGVSVGSSGEDTLVHFNSGTITFHGLAEGATNLASLSNNIQLGTTLVGTSESDAFTIAAPTSPSNFREVDHITQFNPGADVLRFALSTSAYNQFNTHGLSSSSDIQTAYLQNLANNVTITKASAQYEQADPTFTGSNVDSTLNFVDNGHTTGSITLHNVDLGNLNSPFVEVGQQGTVASDNFYYGISGDNLSNFSGNTFIAGFDGSQDYINIALSLSLFNNISNNGNLDSFSIKSLLAVNALPGLGDINVTSVNGSTNLEFVNSAGAVSGSITVDNFTLPSGADINSFGQIRFGSIQQGTSATDTFIYDHAANGNAANLSSFKEFDHLIDFDKGVDNLTIKISDALYNAINEAHFPAVPEVLPTPFPFDPGSPGSPAGAGTSFSDYLANALATGQANGTALGTQISISHTAAQSGSGVDSILQFTTGGTITGTLTLHNLNINSLTEVPHLQIIH